MAVAVTAVVSPTFCFMAIRFYHSNLMVPELVLQIDIALLHTAVPPCSSSHRVEHGTHSQNDFFYAISDGVVNIELVTVVY